LFLTSSDKKLCSCVCSKFCSHKAEHTREQKAAWVSAVTLNTSMRFYEFARSTLKPIKPMSPAQYAIAAKKRQVDQAKDALRREKDTQKRHRELQKQRQSLRQRSA
jgi:hypothetical protein